MARKKPTRGPTYPVPAELVAEFYSHIWELACLGTITRDGQTFGKGNQSSMRHGLVVLWCTACALRFDEMRQLRLDELYSGSSAIYVRRGKRGKDGQVKIDNNLIEITLRWRQMRDETVKSGWLLPNRKGDRLNNDVFNRDVAKPLGALFGCKLSSHSFRDTACQLAMQQSSGNVRSVQRLLGHRSAKTTEIYLAKQQAEALQINLRPPASE